MNNILIKELEEIRRDFTADEIAKFKNEDQFMSAYVELIKHTIKILVAIIDSKYCDEEIGNPIKIDRDNAIIGGNLTRLIKLNTSYLDNVCQRRAEICHIISRCIAETAINIQYLLSNGEKNVRRNYIKHSLITEKSLLNNITKNIEKRGGKKLEIEERIQISIDNSFKKSDFEIDEVNRSSKWKSIAARAESVTGNRLFYDIYFGISSHTTHGNWQDIILHHLDDDEDDFKLNLDWNLPRPQMLDPIIGLNLRVLQSFIEICKLEYSTIFAQKANLLFSYHKDLIIKHEEFYRQ